MIPAAIVLALGAVVACLWAALDARAARRTQENAR